MMLIATNVRPLAYAKLFRDRSCFEADRMVRPG